MSQSSNVRLTSILYLAGDSTTHLPSSTRETEVLFRLPHRASARAEDLCRICDESLRHCVVEHAMPVFADSFVGDLRPFRDHQFDDEISDSPLKVFGMAPRLLESIMDRDAFPLSPVGFVGGNILVWTSGTRGSVLLLL